MSFPTIGTQTREALVAKKITSRVPELIERKKMSLQEFSGHCMLKGLSDFTARRIASGEIKMTTKTMFVVAEVLDASVDELFATNDQ